MDEKYSKDDLKHLDDDIEIFKIEVSKFVIVEMNDILIEEMQGNMRLKNVGQTKKLLKQVVTRLERNIKKIKRYSPKKEYPFWKNFILTIVLVLTLFVMVFFGSELLVGHGSGRSDFVRWIENFLYCGVCLIPPSIFLWMVVFPRLFNDYKLNELEYLLAYDLAKIMALRKFFSEQID